MKRLGLIVFLILLCSGHCCAKGPQIPMVFETFELGVEAVQQFDLLVNGPGDWCLCFNSPAGLMFFADNQMLVDSKVFTGFQKDHNSRSLKVYIDVSSLGVGQHSLDVQITLEGAQGILGLPLTDDEYWILSLNSNEVEVRGVDGARITLESGQWFLLKQGDIIFFQGEQIFLSEKVFSGLSIEHMDSGMPSAELFWEPNYLQLEAGDQAPIKLHIVGPAPAQELLLCPDSDVQLGLQWLLDSEELTVKLSDQDDNLVVLLPSLGPGTHEIRGSLQALLPAQAGHSGLTAEYFGKTSNLDIWIGRDWFDYSSVQLIPLEKDQNARSAFPLLMPDGSIRDSASSVQVSGKRDHLDVIIPLNHPENPFWVGYSLAECIPLTLTKEESEELPVDFFLPILLLNEGFSWRLAIKSGLWFLDLTGQRQLFKGSIGPLTVVGDQDKISLSSGIEYYEEDSGWKWSESVSSRSGTWRHQAWSCTLKLPRQPHQEVAMYMQYAGENWRARLSSEDVVLSYREPKWGWGAQWSSKTLWLELFERRWHFKVNPQKIELGYGAVAHCNWKLQIENNYKWHFQLSYDPWELYFQSCPDRQREGGVRFKLPQSKGSWHYLTKGVCQIKQGLVLAELEQIVGYSCLPQCTVYAKGLLQASMKTNDFSTKANLACGVGVLFRPVPQVITDFGWDTEKGWQFKAGLVVPFVGRKNELQSE